MTDRTVFLAGSTGAIGARLVPLLVRRGHRVFALTRANDKAGMLTRQGATPVFADAFDRATLAAQMKLARPDVVIHQMTDLPRTLDAARMEEGIRRNARLRIEGTANLVAGALDSGVKVLIAQSIAWAYAPGNEPHREDAPLDVDAQGLRAVTVAA